MSEQNQSVEMDTSTPYNPEDNIIAQIIIEQNPSEDMDTTYIAVETTVAQNLTEQNQSGQFDANSAYSLLEKAIAQSMAEQSHSVEIDTTSTCTPVVMTVAESTTEENNSELSDEDAEYDRLLQKTIAQFERKPKSKTQQPISNSKLSQPISNSKLAQPVSNTKLPQSVSNFKPEVDTSILDRKTFRCDICGKIFTHKESFTKHMVRLHGAERMRYFTCACCPRTFKIRKNMLRHMQIVHSYEFLETDQKPSHQIFMREEEGNSELTEENEWICKAKDCVRRKKSVCEQGIQTGCHCIAPKERCLFCRKDKPAELPVFDDSECICFESFFEPEKTVAEVATETGCGQVDCLECDLCPKFDQGSNNNGTGIQCIECNISFTRTTQLRNHLKLVHKYKVDYETHRFPDMNAFKKWKNDIERKEVSLFITRHGAKRSLRGRKYFYDCHRSGKYNARIPARQKMVKNPGSWKLGIICTASMYCEECPDEVIVKYWPHHYGHGKETSFVQISPEEQVAIQENASNGISVENLLDDIRDHQSSSDNSQLYLMKKRDIRFIDNAYNAVEYNPGLSDAESVDQWVRTCCQMEESPVLFYRQEFANAGEEFLLIIMTEFQKHILMSSDKQVICVDSFFRQRGGRFYLTVLFVMDECDIAFPVAFCISNKVNKEVLMQFFTSIMESTGPLDCPYFMSDNIKFYYDAWIEVMNVQSKWLWCLWYVENRIKLQLRAFKSNKRVEVYNTMRVLMDCQNENVFQSIYKNYFDSLPTDPLSKSMGSIVQKYSDSAEMWAYCYRKDVKAGTNMRLEAMHHTFRYCCREGRKKRLDKFIFVIMKLVRYKMLDRLTNVLDEEKMKLAMDAINMFHGMGLEISTENISSLSDKIWLIKSEEEGDVYVTCDFKSCPEYCNLKCAECDICVHMYSCSCMNSMINANLCQHIHAIAWKFLVPHFSPPVSPVPDHFEDMDDTNSTDLPVKSSDLLDSVLKRAHDVYKKVRANKSDLKKDTLTNIMQKLNECVDLCAMKPEQDKSSDQVFVLAPFQGDKPLFPTNVPITVPKRKGTKYLVLVNNKE